MDELEFYQGTATPLRQSLEALESQWRRLDAPIASALRPGISVETVDALAEPHGLTVPLELKVLWTWHDGVEAPGGDASGRLNIGPGNLDFLSVAQCLDAYVTNRRVHVQSDAPPAIPDMYWHASWLPFMVCGPTRLYVDCDRVTFDKCSPVRVVNHAWEEFDVDCSRSLTQAVQMWTWMLEEGYYTWNVSEQVTTVEADWDRIPAWLVRTGLT